VDHSDHVGLLSPAIGPPTPDALWADVGAGSGAFTLALADLLGSGGSIIAIDRDERALRENARSTERLFRGVRLTTRVADFRDGLDLPPLDGIVAANSLHFVARAEQATVVERLASHLKPGGTFVVVEYDSDVGNQWVPNPFSSRAWPALAEAAGLVDPTVMTRVPSRFLGAIYSASAHASRD
jgi:SAM-dependent methyltransferase